MRFLMINIELAQYLQAFCTLNNQSGRSLWFILHLREIALAKV